MNLSQDDVIETTDKMVLLVQYEKLKELLKFCFKCGQPVDPFEPKSTKRQAVS